MNQVTDAQNYNNDRQNSKIKKCINKCKKSNTNHKNYENRREEKKTKSLPKLSSNRNQHRKNQRMVVRNQTGGWKDDRTAATDRDTFFLSLECSQMFEIQWWRTEAKEMQIRRLRGMKKKEHVLVGK